MHGLCTHSNVTIQLELMKSNHLEVPRTILTKDDSLTETIMKILLFEKNDIPVYMKKIKFMASQI